jgi:adenosylhomocysteine nucleosidase
VIAVTFALPAESADFVRLLEKPTLNSREGVESIRGRIHGHSVAVMHTGVGERSCRAQIEPFLRRQQFEYLISAGFAGAVEEELQIGHLLLAENFSSPELLQSPYLDLGDEGLFLGKLVTAPEVVHSISERNRLAAKSGAAAVDMETEVIAAACAEHGLPMLSLRAISDTRSEPFPAPPRVLFDVEKQRTDFVRLAFYLLSHPAAFGRLNAFRQRIAVARHSLTTALEKILRSSLI